MRSVRPLTATGLFARGLYAGRGSFRECDHMGTIADSLFTVLMSWVRALVNAIWALFSSDGTTLLGFLGKHWIAIALVIIAVGLVVDRLVWLIRWRPYHLLAMRVRRLPSRRASSC